MAAHALTFSFNDMDGDNRLRELILYLASKCEDAPFFGAVKLNKMVMVADFSAFVRLGRPITGLEYMRQKAGPVPRRMKPVLSSMETAGEIAIHEVPVGKYTEHRVVPRRPPRLEVFSPQELDVISDAIKFAWQRSGTELSDWSHGKAWQIAGENGAAIPYEAVYLSDAPTTPYEIARTHELNRRYQWEPEPVE
jgi:hypothetical protein